MHRFAVPFTMATALGLGALALDLPLSAAEVGNGLVPPAVAYHVRTFCITRESSISYGEMFQLLYSSNGML